MIPLNLVRTQLIRIQPPDETSLKVLRLLPKTRMRKNPLMMMVVRDKHVVTNIKRVMTPNDIIPMMIIGENNNIHIVGTMVVPLTLQIQAVRVDHVDPLDPTGVDHHMIVMFEDHIVHLVIDTQRENEHIIQPLKVLHIPVTLINLVKVERRMKKSYDNIMY